MIRTRRLSYGDRRHWGLDIGGWNISRWCPGDPCHLPGAVPGRHWIKLRRWR